MNEANIKKLAGKYKVPVGTVEKDYVLSLMLVLLSNLDLSDSLVFKGGTAIKKIYYLEARFSEDLDLNVFDIEIQHIKDNLRGIPELNPFDSVEFGNIKDENESSDSYSCRLNYTGPLNYKNSIKLDFSGKAPPLLKRMEYKPIIDDYKSWEEGVCVYLSYRYSVPFLGGYKHIFDCKSGKRTKFRSLATCWKCTMFTPGQEIGNRTGIQTMNLEEILAEKCRALMMRSMPRDLYDIMFLLERGVSFDASLVKKKLKGYEEEWTTRSFDEKLDTLESLWKRDLRSLLPEVPDFHLAVRSVKSKIWF